MASILHPRSIHAPERSTATISGQQPFWRLLLLHLAPGAIFTAFLMLAVPVLTAREIDPAFALFAGIGLVLVPLELGYLALHAHRTTGSWSPLAVVDYRRPLPVRQLVRIAAVLVTWFMLCLAVSVAFIDQSLADHVFAWAPDSLLQLTGLEETDISTTGWAVVALFALALVCNGILGPITEELYFRGHLLPQLERYGHWAPVINTVLFASYHFFSPWRYLAIILGFLPTTWMVWRRKSLWISIAVHVTINILTVVLLFAAM